MQNIYPSQGIYTPVKRIIPHETIKKIKLTPNECDDTLRRDLQKIGIDLTDEYVNTMSQRMQRTFDSASAFHIPPAFTPINWFLQQFLPGYVATATAVRKCDELAGQTFIGDWEDANIIRRRMNRTGYPTEFGDRTNTSLVEFKASYDIRTVVRFEIGIQTGLLEDARNTKAQWETMMIKRSSALLTLDVARNAIFFFGWADGLSRTYGILNDPNLNPIVEAPSAQQGGWNKSDYIGIISDLKYAFSLLRMQSQGIVDPSTDAVTLAVPPGKYESLNTPNTVGGTTVLQWLQSIYTKLRLVQVPELNGVFEGGSSTTDDMMYLFADKIDTDIDGSTDGGQTLMQLLEARARSLGVRNEIKVFEEIFTNAQAGGYIQRSYTLVQLGGI